MHRNKPDLSFDFREKPRGALRACDHPGCAESGEYRAPKGRQSLNEYWWFCLEHVREYNRSWDFYAGMSQDEIERAVRHDTTWQRPTWPMGNWRTRERVMRDKLFTGGFAFGADWGEERPQEPPRARPRTPEEEALAVLDLPAGSDFATVKTRYRQLAKKHHPDANGGSKEAEERLKRINQAYNTLKGSFGPG
ncbi:J domain-containing protein [Oleisolibacter albus]|uniref:J domain-containing protein n=1 Tax=Oleisolibacter albus TaxID=2171757 RepID=UPI000DF1D2ED|nr:J domain-containing protein [Oleisolibacter albus]